MREFPSLTAFAEHLLTTAVAIAEADHLALEHVGKHLETEAKKKVGEYQTQAGPFAAWAPLADSTIADKERSGFSPPDNPLLRTGEMRESIQHKVVGLEAHVGSDSDIAVFQELGTSRMPPRSFLGSTAVEQTDKVVEIIGGAVVVTLVGEQVHMGSMSLAKYI